MRNNAECLMYLVNAKTQLIEDFPNNNDLSNILFLKICDFINTDFDGVSENKIYRSFLSVIIDVIEISFQGDASKSYLRSFFKKLKNRIFINYLSMLMPSKSDDISFTIDRLVNFFVYQDSTSKKAYRLEETLSYLKAKI